uniref:Uncharacterized protein n=1 Tax=Rhizophora mucronata TaxID=61149 RepID=A0A2P2PF35_RHIMU
MMRQIRWIIRERMNATSAAWAYLEFFIIIQVVCIQVIWFCLSLLNLYNRSGKL